MIWDELIVENFLSFPKFTLQLNNQGIILVEGENLTSSKFKSNGSGKSSLLEPIVYALYDTTSKGIKADEVVNNKVKKNCSVILKGHEGDTHYRIERYRKHSKNKNKVKLFINDEEVTAKSTADTNAMIQKIIGIDYNTFVNSIMFSQGSGAGRFAIATDKEKKEILDNLAKLHIYASAQDIAKERVKAKDTEISNKEREGERLQWELAQVDTLEEQDKENYQKTLDVLEKEKQTWRDVCDERGKYRDTYQAQAKTLLEEIEHLKTVRDGLNSTPDNTYTTELNNITNQLNTIRLEKQSLEYQKADIVKNYQKLQSATNCPMCGSPLDTTHRDKEMADLKEKLRDILISLQYVQKDVEQLEAKHGEVNANFQEIKAKNDSLVQEYRGISNQITVKENQYGNYQTTLQNYDNRLAAIENTLNKLREVPEPAPRTQQREDIQNKIKAQKEQLLALQKEKKILEDAVKIYSNSGVKSHVLDLKTPFLNKQANKYLAMLSGPDMEVTFSTQTQKKDGDMSEKFDVQLTNVAGGENYKSNSEGEKKRADLSIALALQDLVMSRSDTKINFAVYDEVFDALDSVGAENVVTLLKERQKDVGTIFVVTHNEHLKALFDRVITVTKNKDGFSTLSEGEKIT